MVLRGAPVVVVAGEGWVGGGLQRAVVAPCLPGCSVVMMGVCRIALARGEEKGQRRDQGACGSAPGLIAGLAGAVRRWNAKGQARGMVVAGITRSRFLQRPLR